MAEDTQSEQPIAQALVICDSVIDDITSRKKSLIGIFSIIRAGSFPVQHPQMFVYASFTNGRGQLQLTLRCVRVTDEKEIFRAAGPINFPDPNQVVEMIFNLRGVPFEQPGLYTFELICQDDLLLEKRFIVEQLKTT